MRTRPALIACPFSNPQRRKRPMEETQVVHTLPFVYAVFKYIHILLFVYWLGGDAGVFYSSTFVVNNKLSRDARLTAFKIFINLDMLPRYCLALDADGGRHPGRVRRLQAPDLADDWHRGARPDLGLGRPHGAREGGHRLRQDAGQGRLLVPVLHDLCAAHFGGVPLGHRAVEALSRGSRRSCLFSPS